jgi:hypothetical protein
MKKIFIFSIILLFIVAPAWALLFGGNTGASTEPTTMLLLGLWLIGIAGLRRNGLL